ncbi:hypothetical protein C4544_01140 [candidate division WS5 bacterium]|uniref:Uncharacterized protein n=1 Tax=candidate division WS5 bacterium TaxID=2093353 RepID=A0A419DG83_9BACT|nr:MAG: hypothetical protein C4544_01140 [candidate division WS5 bacterium]
MASLIDWPKERETAEKRLSMSMKGVIQGLIQYNEADQIGRVMRYIGDVLDSALSDYQSYISQGGLDG